MHNRTISVLNTITIPGRTIQLLDVTLPAEVSSSSWPQACNCVSCTRAFVNCFSPVSNGNHAVVQVMNISPTAVTVYTFPELLLVESQQQQQQPVSSVSTDLDIDLTHCTISTSQKQELVMYSQLMITLLDVLQLYAMPSTLKYLPFGNPCVGSLLPCRVLSTLKLIRFFNKV